MRAVLVEIDGHTIRNTHSAEGYFINGTPVLPCVAEKVQFNVSEPSDGKARIETDMRAHQNPTRQIMIRVIARKLARRLSAPCTQCAIFQDSNAKNVACLLAGLNPWYWAAHNANTKWKCLEPTEGYRHPLTPVSIATHEHGSADCVAAHNGWSAKNQSPQIAPNKLTPTLAKSHCA